jgi:hypothetical protein
MHLDLLGELEAVDIGDRPKDIVRLLVKVRLIVNALNLCFKVRRGVQS